MNDPARNEVSRILRESGSSASTELLPVLYDELRVMAAQFLRSERQQHTLQATALVHEAFLRLVDNDCAPARGEFLAAAANTMRRILIDHARRVGAEKRGGGWDRVTLGGVADEPANSIDVLALHGAMEQLEELDERQARIVEMRFFAGMTGDEIAAQLGVSRNTVVRDLRMAKAWLERALGDDATL